MRGQVSVTRHAYDQACARFPEEFRELAHSATCEKIRAEVVAAVEAGRMAKTLPRFAIRAGTHERRIGKRQKGGHSRARYVWTEDERRVYVIHRFDRGATGPGGKQGGNPLTLIVTTIRSGSLDLDEAAA